MSLKSFVFDPGRDGIARDLGLLVLRLGFAGAMVVAHGWGKLQRFGTTAEQFPDPLGIGAPLSMALATFAELFCAAALALGFLSRLAVLPLLATMAVAFFLVHGGDPFAERELAWAYLVAFLVLLLTGPGRFSVDTALRGR